jgi:UDP-sulfoquinovose synthase
MKNNILVLGGDGYFGWSLGLALAKRTNNNVILVDNLIKRIWEKQVSAKPLFPYKNPKDRILEYTRIYGKKNLFFEKLDLLEYDSIVKIIKKYNPSVIVNAAQQPSAPFSMISSKNAGATFCNNILGHLNVVWAIAEVNRDVSYIKLGSAGVYCGVNTDFYPLKRVDLNFKYNKRNHKVLNTWLPMHATDFYHQSKIADFLISDLVAETWGLKMATVQQSTIFGSGINENIKPEHHTLSSRFNYDAVFGTVLNRFVCQLAIKEPLTVYGDGKQETSLISLSDTVDVFLNLIETNLIRGNHEIVHNQTIKMSINEVALLVGSLSKNAYINYIKNPRKEKKRVTKKQNRGSSCHNRVTQK